MLSLILQEVRQKKEREGKGKRKGKGEWGEGGRREEGREE